MCNSAFHLLVLMFGSPLYESRCVSGPRRRGKPQGEEKENKGRRSGGEKEGNELTNLIKAFFLMFVCDSLRILFVHYCCQRGGGEEANTSCRMELGGGCDGHTPRQTAPCCPKPNAQCGPLLCFPRLSVFTFSSGTSSIRAPSAALLPSDLRDLRIGHDKRESHHNQ